MTYPRKRWKVAAPAPESLMAQIAGQLGIPGFMAQILYNRGVKTVEQAAEFFEDCVPDVDPFKLQGLNKAVDRIRRAIRNGEQIAVYGDFDVDGITATAVLTETLQALGARVRPYIPNRFNEGYGLNKDTLSTLASENVRLIVTVDCGIRSPDEISHACSLGVDMIVTDHHSVGSELPPALAVVNPKQNGCGYGFQDLAGVGVAFKLAQALMRVNAHVPLGGKVTLCEDDLLDLVALGTVADLVPLVGENRRLVRRGLRVLNELRRPGIEALAQAAGLRRGRINTVAIGFVLGPRLNAAGRLDDAGISYSILTSRDPHEADTLATELDLTNDERRRQTSQAVEIARGQVVQAAQGAEDCALLVAVHEQFPQGIVGLVAGRLTEEYYRPAVVIERRPQFCRGSARSIDEFDITAALDCCQDLLVRYGGHAAAAGFTVEADKLGELVERLHAIAQRELAGRELLPSVDVDVEVPLPTMTVETARELEKLEPCGIGNPSPLFMTRGLTVRSSRPVGKESQHLKLSLFDGRTSREAIAFGLGGWASRMPVCVDVVYALETNDWYGDERPQLRIEDIRPCGE